MSLVIAPCPATHPDALRLIAESDATLAALYAPEDRFGLSPEQLEATGVHFLLARLDGKAVGCGGLAVLDGYGELKRIFTVPAMRGRGVAAAIVGALEATALARGLALLRLETGEPSAAAIRLYERLGYRRCGPFGNYPEDGVSVFMEKRLG